MHEFYEYIKYNTWKIKKKSVWHPKFQLPTVVSILYFEKQVPDKHVIRNKSIALRTLRDLCSSLLLLTLVKAY